jgi:regulator of protease activity HflC (stomatin/prohibitin superfamily)
MNHTQKKTMKTWTKVALVGAGVALLGYIGSRSIYKVPPGHRAVIFSRVSGIQPQEYEQGYHLLVPFVQRALLFSARLQLRNIRIHAVAKDSEDVGLLVRLVYAPQVGRFAQLFAHFGRDFAAAVLPSATNEVVCDVVSQLSVFEFVRGRRDISAQIQERIGERLDACHIHLRLFALLQLDFRPECREAIDAKLRQMLDNCERRQDEVSQDEESQDEESQDENVKVKCQDEMSR